MKFREAIKNSDPMRWHGIMTAELEKLFGWMTPEQLSVLKTGIDSMINARKRRGAERLTSKEAE